MIGTGLRVVHLPVGYPFVCLADSIVSADGYTFHLPISVSSGVVNQRCLPYSEMKIPLVFRGILRIYTKKPSRNSACKEFPALIQNMGKCVSLFLLAPIYEAATLSTLCSVCISYVRLGNARVGLIFVGDCPQMTSINKGEWVNKRW